MQPAGDFQLNKASNFPDHGESSYNGEDRRVKTFESWPAYQHVDHWQLQNSWQAWSAQHEGAIETSGYPINPLQFSHESYPTQLYDSYPSPILPTYPLIPPPPPPPLHQAPYNPYYTQSARFDYSPYTQSHIYPSAAAQQQNFPTAEYTNQTYNGGYAD